MPKTHHSKHVKFESIDQCVVDSPENSATNEQQGGSGHCHSTSPTGGGGSGSSRLHSEKIEIHIEDENGVRQPYHHHDQPVDHCSGCHMLGQPHKHQRVTTLDQADDDEDDGCRYSPQQGPHIILLTVLCIPFVFVTALIVTGYLGVLTWYNIFLYYYDERGWIHRILVCPLLILSFPPIILIIALGISVYSSIQQLSWYLASWRKSVTDLEKGFYAWLCLHLGLQDCSPYEVITQDLVFLAMCTQVPSRCTPLIVDRSNVEYFSSSLALRACRVRQTHTVYTSQQSAPCTCIVTS